MAKEIVRALSYKEIIVLLQKADLVTAKEIRRALEKEQINQLKVTGNVLEKIRIELSRRQESTNPATLRSAVDLKKLIEGGTVNPDDPTGRILAPAKVNAIKNLIKSIGLEGDWAFGHEGLGNLSAAFGIMRSEFRKGQLEPDFKKLLDSAIVGNQTIERLEGDMLSKLRVEAKKDSDTLKKYMEGVPNNIIFSDLEAASSFVSDMAMGTARITYVIEDRAANSAKGALSGNLSRPVRAALKAGTKVKETLLFKKLIAILNKKDPANIKNSPSLYELLDSGGLEEFFLTGKKPKRKSGKGKNIRKTRKEKSPNTAIIKKLQKSLISKKKTLSTALAARLAHKKFIMPTVSLKALINESLADFIELRMANSSAPASINYLRLQTGTFSESARLLTLNRQQTGAYTGVYTYQHEPYEVFEQGHKLGSPGRDPRLYIEGAARAIATQVLKKHFKGIALESK